MQVALCPLASDDLDSGRSSHAGEVLVTYCANDSQVDDILSSAAFHGAEVVFHMAAPNSSINNYKLQHSVNVEGNIGYLLI